MIDTIISLFRERDGATKLSILTAPLFLVGLLIKLLASPFFASSYFTSLFVPFLNYFTRTFDNPYNHFADLGTLSAFPYPSMMLYIVSAPKVILSPALNIFPYLQNISVDLLLYRLPLLAADITILVILSRWIKNHTLLLVLYWLSPILFAITYLHGQLDVIPIALVFVFLYFLFKEHLIIASVALGLAIATKFHIILLVPFALFYLWRKQSSLLDVVFHTIIVGSTFILVNGPFINSHGFYSLVFHNTAQLKIFDLAIAFTPTTALFVVPALYVALLVYITTFTFFSRDVFVMFIGFCFGALTLFIAPMPGWYYWIIPFLVYFYAKNPTFPRGYFWLLSLAYFIYFLCSEGDQLFTLIPEYHSTLFANISSLFHSTPLSSPYARNLSFSVLQILLFINILWIARRGIEESKKQKLHSVPFLIGIAGDSGSGKSTFTHMLQGIFSKNEIAVVEGDALHKWERGHSMWQTLTHLDPRANELHNDIHFAKQLQTGSPVYRRRYDHHSGTFTTPVRISSKRIIVFEGLHTFYLTEMRSLFDCRIFIKPEDGLRIHWKVTRDMSERGHKKEKILAQIQQRKGDSEKHIDVQESYADIVFSLHTSENLKDSADTTREVSTILHIHCNNDIAVDEFTEKLRPHLVVTHTIDIYQQHITISGEITSERVQHISHDVLPELYELFHHDPHWEHGQKGVMQLFTAYHIFATLKKNNYV